METWVVSPNISNAGGRVLEKWKQLVVERACVFMGWSPDATRDTRVKLGQLFAGTLQQRRGVEEGDLIVVAYREDWKWHPVACGIVSSPACTSKFGAFDWKELGLGRGYHGTERELNPFVVLRAIPKRILSMEGTTPDWSRSSRKRRRSIVALVKLEPESNLGDRKLRSAALDLLKRGQSRETVEEQIEGVIEGMRGQGRVLSPAERRAIEERAVTLAIKHFERKGYTVKPKGKPYDLLCTKKKRTLYVEVKGTQSEGRSVILTRNEVEHAREHPSALFVVSEIALKGSRSNPTATGGYPSRFEPWNIEERALSAKVYEYFLPARLGRARRT